MNVDELLIRHRKLPGVVGQISQHAVCRVALVDAFAIELAKQHLEIQRLRKIVMVQVRKMKFVKCQVVIVSLTYHERLVNF
jgi:hypothetical protein